MPPRALAPEIPALLPPLAQIYDFRFVGEGASNVVFEVVAGVGGMESNIFVGNLLRVPKAGTRAHSYIELQEYWETVIKPLFEPEDLVHHQLVRLGGEAIVSRLNDVLEKEDATRRPDFRGSRVAVAEYGMLVEDMRQKDPDDLTFEFKPKWLAQSPNAPPSATRCRNCAREASKYHTNPNKPRPAGRILCPLDFLHCPTNPPVLSHVLAHLSSLSTAPSPQPPPAHQLARLRRWLRTNTVLPRLRAAQLANDQRGPLEADAHDARFQLAMTLRDCTCFVRVPADPSAPVEAKLGDLDKKNWAVKLAYWQATERRLIEGGYYEGKERASASASNSEEEEGGGVRTDCQLERAAFKRGGCIVGVGSRQSMTGMDVPACDRECPGN
ncbi:hypothetical protein VTK26DRAFT_5600 [Humicola hyalothermophila]